MNEHDVVIAGGGPTGMMLASELVLAGVDVVVVERRPSHDLDGSRAGGLLPRTLEVLDQRGVVERFVAEGQAYPTHGFAMIPLAIGDLPTRHDYVLALWQKDIERIMGAWMAEIGVPFVRERWVEGCTQDDGGVDVALSDGTTLRARYLVGCDGGRSTVRKAAGIGFPGWDPSVSYLIAEVDTAEPPPIGMRPEGGGIGPRDGRFGMALREPRVDNEGEPTLDDLRALLVSLYGTDFGVHSPTWISRFTDMSRQADRYRAGRVLVAGDAAHIHSPNGGQGLNTGVQDAVNLGWKLAQVLAGTSPESLLDTYHAERHPVAARVLRNTMAQTALADPDERHQALRETVVDLLGIDEARHRIASMLCALDLHYDLGQGDGAHPLVGRRLPDLDLDTGRAYHHLREAKPVFLDLAGTGVEPAGVRTVRATYDGLWVLPVLGEVEAPGSVLVRPDGHVAWTGAVDDGSLATAVRTWFGPGGE